MHRGLRYLGNNALGALALFVALGGTTYAATGGLTGGGKLQACVNENGGLTLLKSGKKCKKGQRTIAWNMTGPGGAAGAKGVAGAPGAAGAQGAQGGQGSQGAAGSAVAYAHVEMNGTLDTANSSGVVDARLSPISPKGVYCVYGNFTAHVATATVTYGESPGQYVVSEAVVNGIYVPALCPSSSTGAPAKAVILVRDFTNENAPPSEAGFYITFN